MITQGIFFWGKCVEYKVTVYIVKEVRTLLFIG